jgi:hypothetical protein
MEELPETFQLMIKNQMEATQNTGKRCPVRKFHPSLLRFALGLCGTSPRAYDLLSKINV